MAGPVTIAWSRARPGDAASLPDVGTRQTARLRRLSGVAADRFAVGRGFAAALIREIAGVDAATDLVSECERCGIGTHGRLRDAANRVALSVAYADDLVVVAAADRRDVDAVGVDVERDDDVSAARVAALTRLFAPHPAPTLAEWTRIEAALKADGRGLRVEPQDVRFTQEGYAIVAHVPGGLRAWEVATIAGPRDHVVSVALAPAVRSAR